MVMVLPSTDDRLLDVGARVGVGTLVGARRPGSTGCCSRGPDRSGRSCRPSSGSMPKATSSAVTGVAVLPLDAVTDRELPLGEVVVGRAEVGGQVGDQDHLPGLRVVVVLRQLTGHQRRHDRVGVGVVEAPSGRCGVVRPVEVSTVTVPPFLAPSMVDRTLTGRVRAVAGVAEVLGVDARAAAAAAAVAVAAAATGGEGEEAGGGQRPPIDLFNRIAISPFSLVVPQSTRRRSSTTSPRVERVSDESPRRLRESVSSVIAPTGSHR